MTRPDEPILASTLSKHAGAMRRLARALLRDAGDADDLMQDAAVVALRRRAPLHGAGRSWISGVVRMLARRKRAASAREAARRATLSPDETPALEPSAEAALKAKELVATLMCALEEPYRTTLWLRHYQDRPPREIAMLMGCSVHTVKTRLQRGLRVLRARLDARDVDEVRSWRHGLVLVLSAPSSAATGGAFKWAAVALLALGTAGGVVVATGAPRPEGAIDKLEPRLADVGAGAEPKAVLRGMGRGVQPEPQPTGDDFLELHNAIDPVELDDVLSTAQSEAQVARDRAARLRALGRARDVRVVDATGRPVGDARVQVHVAWKGGIGAGHPVESVRTEANGVARVRLATQHRWVVLAHVEGQAGTAHVAAGTSDAPVEVRLGTAVTIRGRVEDQEQRGLEGALVVASNVITAVVGGLIVRADDDGRFEFPAVPVTGLPKRIALTASKDGFVDGSLAFERERARHEHTVVLAASRSVQLQVVDDEGQPVPGAHARCGGDKASASPDGHLHLRRVKREAEFIDVTALGYAPRRIVLPDGPRVDLGRIQLSKGQSIKGTVTWASERPRGRIAVEARRHADGTPLRLAWVRPDGTFELPNLGGEKYVLTFSRLDRLSDDVDYREIRVVGGTPRVDVYQSAAVQLRLSAALSIRFVDRDGEPRGHTCWELSVMREGRRVASLDLLGRAFERLGLPLPAGTGRYTLTLVHGKERKTLERSIDVVSGRQAELEIRSP